MGVPCQDGATCCVGEARNQEDEICDDKVNYNVWFKCFHDKKLGNVSFILFEFDVIIFHFVIR